MPDIVVSIINDSSVVTDDACRTLTAALQKQVSRDFAPVWGTDAKLVFVPNGQAPEKGTWWLSILDSTDRPGALGHHDLTPDGLPVGKSFAGTDLHYGFEWTVTASHELLEMLANPDINRAILVRPEQGDAKLYAYEVCDPCEDDADSYAIDGIKVCNFLYPTYFESFHHAATTKFDHQGRLTAPVPAVLPGGYISMYDLNGSAQWQQISNAAIEPDRRARSQVAERHSSRRERRQLPRSEWKHAKVPERTAP